MKRISIFLLSLVFVFIPLNPAMAEQDYLDKRWAKTGCKPLNKQTKMALIVTDVVLDPNELGEVKNIQKLWFQKNNLQKYKWIKTTMDSKQVRIIPMQEFVDQSTPFLFNQFIPSETKTLFVFNTRTAAPKGYCDNSKYSKNRIYTVFLLKERNDKKPYKWLQFQSTGKGTDSSL